MYKVLTAKKLTCNVSICFVLLIAIMIICASVGTQKISLKKVFQGQSEQSGENIDYQIMVKFRIPRVILATLVGAALASSGVILQALLRNPLADPYILGISSGAGLGVVIALLSGVTWGFWGGTPVALFAFIGAISTVWLVWFIGHFTARAQVTALLLAGVVINAFFSAIIMFLVSIAKNEQLRETIMWLMGNITEKSMPILWASGCLIIAGISGLMMLSHKLNVLTLGVDEAKSLGVNAARTKLLAFGLSAYMTSIAVSLSGLIGFVGLIIPHAVRLVFGPDHRQLLPISAIIGGAFLAIADTLARTMFGQEQFPVGVITAMAGGPFFLILLAKYSRKVSWLK